MFASVQKLAYLSGLRRHLFVGVYSGSASTAAMVRVRPNSAALPAQGFVVHLMDFMAELSRRVASIPQAAES